MRRLAAPLLGVAVLSYLGVARCEDPPSIEWENDLDAARARAKTEGKPLFIVFR